MTPTLARELARQAVRNVLDESWTHSTALTCLRSEGLVANALLLLDAVDLADALRELREPSGPSSDHPYLLARFEGRTPSRDELVALQVETEQEYDRVLSRLAGVCVDCRGEGVLEDHAACRCQRVAVPA